MFSNERSLPQNCPGFIIPRVSTNNTITMLQRVFLGILTLLNVNMSGKNRLCGEISLESTYLKLNSFL